MNKNIKVGDIVVIVKQKNIYDKERCGKFGQVVNVLSIGDGLLIEFNFPCHLGCLDHPNVGFYSFSDVKKIDKIVKSFDERKYGLFINTKKEMAAVSIAKQTGNVFLDEEVGENSYNNAILHLKNNVCFKIKEIQKDSIEIIIVSEGLQDHVVGRIYNDSHLVCAAYYFVEKCNNLFIEKKKERQDDFNRYIRYITTLKE